MNFKRAVQVCHVSGSIYREGNPKVKYNKNSFTPLEERVPESEKVFDDWEEYDPEEDYGHY
jgi:hypothetical protein